jgi:hypothetical protein
MSRDINSSVVTEIAKDSVRMCHLLEVHFSTVVYYTDAPQDISYSANTYLSSGHILKMQAIQEASDIRVGSAKIKLSGVDQTFVTLLLNASDSTSNSGYIGRQVRILRAFLDSSNSIIGVPILIYDGRIDGHEIRDSATTSEVDLLVASHWADFEKKSGRMTNSNSQKLFFSSDKGFDFAANVVKDIKWGKA